MKSRTLFIIVIVCCFLISGIAIVSTLANSGSQTDNQSVVDITKTPIVTPTPTMEPVPTSTPTQSPTPEPTPIPTPEEVSVDGIDLDKPIVALSFDDGPSFNDSTTRILNVIEKYGISATFFQIGEQIPGQEKVLQRQIALGCEIGSHTMTHNLNFKKDNLDDVVAEINESDELIYSATGKHIKLVRPPWGAYNDEALQRIDYPLILWSVDTLDWQSRDKNAVFAEVKKSTYDGCIILMHDLYSTTADAVELVVPWLLEQGYQIVNVSQLFAARGVELSPHATYRNAKPNR